MDGFSRKFFSAIFVAILHFSYPPATVEAAPAMQERRSCEPLGKEAMAERFVAELQNHNLYEISEGVYAGDRRYLMNVHIRRGIGWPQIATLIIHAKTDRLLMGVLVSTQDDAANRVTVVLTDQGFLHSGVPNGCIIQTDPDTSGTRFYEAYRRVVME